MIMHHESCIKHHESQLTEMEQSGFLAGKRVLFVSAKLFSISDNIRTAMERLGAVVDYFDERPSNTPLMKALIRINRNLVASAINTYYDRMIEATASIDFDYILFTKGESVSARQLRRLRELHPRARMVLYHWDAIYYNHHAKAINRCFDKVATFDRPDAEEYGMEFLPLFYTPEYSAIQPIADNRIDYAAAFIGTTHSDRYAIATSVARQLASYGQNVMMYFYFQSRMMYYKRMYADRIIDREWKECFHFSPLSHREILDAYSHTVALIDVQWPHQRGLTMRTIEALGARRKLITTNTDIVNYDFYDEDNILVVDRDHPHVPSSFTETPFRPLPANIYRRYSIASWLHCLLVK